MARGPGKGNTNNPDGRPKGSKNARTQQWEKLGEFITERGAARAMQILDEMDDEMYLDQYGRLLNYFKPKLASTQLEAKADISINITAPDGTDYLQLE